MIFLSANEDELPDKDKYNLNTKKDPIKLIKLNKLIRKDSSIFDKLRGKKIILNRSLLTNKDVADFEYESNSKIFFNIPNLDDKKEYHKALEDFLIEMGFSRFKPTSQPKGKNIFSIFNK